MHYRYRWGRSNPNNISKTHIEVHCSCGWIGMFDTDRKASNGDKRHLAENGIQS